MASVDYVRRELGDMLGTYQRMDDVCAGQDAIKNAQETYLPKPRIDGIETPETKERYKDYIQRAQFVNFTGRTVEGLSGLIFAKAPVVKLPPLCGVIEKNADGSGVDLVQLTKVAVQHVIKKGRAGVFVDYPETDRPATRAQLESGDVRPVILIYNPGHIVNWDIGVRGGKVYYTLIVLKEIYNVRKPDDFETQRRDQYRVLELVDESGNRFGETVGPNPIYRQTIYRKADSVGTENRAGYSPSTSIFPKDSKGKNIPEIPFTFIGAVSNDATVDKPPLLDIANVNIGHYINSADHEDSCFMVGQPTPVISGLTQEWWTKQLNKRITLGSRTTIPLNQGAKLELICAQPNTMASAGMMDKERQMVALGAKLIEEGKVSKTATEDTNDNIAENSVLGNIANNVEAAIKFALEWCAIFTGDILINADAKDKSIDYRLNKKFNTHGSTAADRAQLLKEWMSDGISKTEYRANLRLSGAVLDEDEKAQAEIEKEQEDQLDFETERNKALAAAGVGNQPGGNVDRKVSKGAIAA